ncbi:uncharacterized protein LOC128385536 [Panonychus citri]|uniref:uncharacterized protein LOC128385536 n=1 Tax=Panonychus citri TaxID=50023 RepID=UPI00230833B0|nr:uncharacterized protein LOC128385536 [Panonychus citri]
MMTMRKKNKHFLHVFLFIMVAVALQGSICLGRKHRAEIGICRSHDSRGNRTKISCMIEPKVYCCPVLSGDKPVKICCTLEKFLEHHQSLIIQVSFMFIINVLLLVAVICLSVYGYYLLSILPEIKVD